MSNVIRSFLTFILFTIILACNAARLEPADQLLRGQHQEMNEAEIRDEISCDGLQRDECLFRRSLAAHLDYIYTQKQQP
ncbi:phytosulfokines-like [Amaranthus tricolor]|uniref:phytosulfokines-like n=1 Tax=Amaranthus tricolor TaxID=29722 RepID=UPI0025863B6F|nr:phytosulfokines-like [Amaranthus tricolor]